MGARSGAGAGGRVGMRAGTGIGARTGVRTGTGAQASRTALRILCKLSLEYLGTLVAATGASAMGGFAPEGPAGWSDNLSPDSGGRKESRGATERATERTTEGLSSKTLFQTAWLTCWV